MIVLLLLFGLCNAQLRLSNVFGDNMVLQRAPLSAVVWGFAKPSTVVTTSFQGLTFANKTDSNGIWRQTLPSTQAGGPYNISFVSADGNAALKNVLFGDVYLCGGQSNMQFTVIQGNNAQQEIALAHKYPNIRVFTVGQGTQSTTPLNELKTIEQTWSVADSPTIGGKEWDYFSAVCWLFGRDVYDGLGGSTPIGLISNNWGGTAVEQWSSPEVYSKCGSQGSGNLWNAMIVPYTVGPMAIKGATWYQGEANVGHADTYKCFFPAMIADWRAKLDNDMWFGFVQIAGYNYGAGPNAGDLRWAQMSALQLPNIGYSTAIDVGNPTNIHPTNKQTVAQRLSNSALDMIYGVKGLKWRCPIYTFAVDQSSGKNILVTVSFDTLEGTITTNVPSYAKDAQADICPSPLTAADCGFPTLTLTNGDTVIANVTVSADGKQLIFSAVASVDGLRVSATSYGRSSWPVTKFFTTNGLPVIPWYAQLRCTGPVDCINKMDQVRQPQLDNSMKWYSNRI